MPTQTGSLHHERVPRVNFGCQSLSILVPETLSFPPFLLPESSNVMGAGRADRSYRIAGTTEQCLCAFLCPSPAVTSQAMVSQSPRLRRDRDRTGPVE